MVHSFLISTKRNTTLGILVKLNVKIFAGENFAVSSFAIHRPFSQKFIPEKIKKFLLLTKKATIFRENIKNRHDLQIFIPQNTIF